MPIAPSDAAVAARSFPRRWRQLFAVAGDDDDTGLLDRPGGSGRSAVSLAGEARDALAGAATRLGAAAPAPSADVLDGLEAAALALADRIDRVDRGIWQGGDALGTLDAAIDRAATALREAERVLAEVRGRPVDPTADRSGAGFGTALDDDDEEDGDRR